jgi:hypothetical protein
MFAQKSTAVQGENSAVSSLQKCCDFNGINANLFACVDKLFNEFSLDFGHFNFTSRLHNTAPNCFSVFGSVPEFGYCGYEAVLTCLAAEGVLLESRKLKCDVVECMVKTFQTCNGGLGTIDTDYDGDEPCFLERFRLSQGTSQKIHETHSCSTNNKNNSPGFVITTTEDCVTYATNRCSDKYQKLVFLFKDYVAQSRKKDAWLDEFACIFLARVLKRSVMVYSIELKSWVEFRPSSIQLGLPSIHLLLMGKYFAPLVTNNAMKKRLWERCRDEEDNC